MSRGADCFKKMASKAELIVNFYPHPSAKGFLLNLLDAENLEESQVRASISERNPFSFRLDDLVLERGYLIEIWSFGREDKVVERSFIKIHLSRERSQINVYPISGLWEFERPLSFRAVSEDRNIYDSLLIKPLREVDYQRTHESFLINRKERTETSLETICFMNYGGVMVLFSPDPSLFAAKGGEGGRILGLDTRSFSTSSGVLRPFVFPEEAEKLIYPVCSFSDANTMRVKLFEVFIEESRKTVVRDEKESIRRFIEEYKKIRASGVIEREKFPVTVKDAVFILPDRDCLSKYKSFCVEANPKEVNLKVGRGDLYIYSLNLKRVVH